MADITKVRAGDKLRLEVEVSELSTGAWPSYPVRVKGLRTDAGVWLEPEIIEAAEHIPAPKQFKRGDWVRLGSVIVPWAETDLFRHGWVTGTSGAGRVLVSWPHAPQSLDSLEPQNLEHDEAPE